MAGFLTLRAGVARAFVGSAFSFLVGVKEDPEAARWSVRVASELTTGSRRTLRPLAGCELRPCFDVGRLSLSISIKCFSGFLDVSGLFGGLDCALVGVVSITSSVVAT